MVVAFAVVVVTDVVWFNLGFFAYGIPDFSVGWNLECIKYLTALTAFYVTLFS